MKEPPPGQRLALHPRMVRATLLLLCLVQISPAEARSPLGNLPRTLRLVRDKVSLFCAYQRLPRDIRRYVRSLGRDRSGTRVAVFDADFTLWNGDVGTAFFKWMIRHNHLTPRMRQPARTLWRDFKRGKIADTDAFLQMVTLMQGLPLKRVQELATGFYRQSFAGAEFRPMHALIRKLKRKGITPHICTGSNPWIVAVGAQTFGIPRSHIHGIETKVKDGVLTGVHIDAPVTWREGKRDRMRHDLPQKTIVLAAGDSFSGDSWLLGMAKKAFFVSPSNKYRNPAGRRVAEKKARARGWQPFRMGRRQQQNPAVDPPE